MLLYVALILWYVPRRTSAGRRVYASGGNPQAASLAGCAHDQGHPVRADHLSVMIAGLSGLLLTSQLSTGDPTVGPGYLLPVIAAVFLGSTQFPGGRFNIWGTVVAAYTLAVGCEGLAAGRVPFGIP